MRRKPIFGKIIRAEWSVESRKEHGKEKQKIAERSPDCATVGDMLSILREHELKIHNIIFP
jgi:hypothetical protein